LYLSHNYQLPPKRLQHFTESIHGKSRYFNVNGAATSQSYRANGFSVRCIKDNDMPDPETCTATSLEYCYTEAECETVAGYWYNGTCNGSPVPTVTSAGQVWMDRNFGASRVATSFDDEEAYGDLYQWGRGADGHEKRTSPTTLIISSSDVPSHGSFITQTSSPYNWRTSQNDNLWQGVSGTNNPCPSRFRLPTKTELNTEKVSWQSDSQAGAFVSPTKLVRAGYRGQYDGKIYDDEYSFGNYWSSTVIDSYSWMLRIRSDGSNIGGLYRGSGFSVRCVKD
jgi:uncharacterized protein (TIGR02145 family)